MLEFMSEENIFYVELSGDKTALKVTESCDHYYSAVLAKHELLELITDLQTLADQMVVVKNEPSKDEQVFWDEFPGLLLDDTEVPYNNLITKLRSIAWDYWH